jgi:hypothetical protein
VARTRREGGGPGLLVAGLKNLPVNPDSFFLFAFQKQVFDVK